jgi:hypothetical protein
MAKIPLPDISNQHGLNNLHPYPIQIGKQTIEFIRATWFEIFLTNAVAELYAESNPEGWKSKAFSRMREQGIETSAISPGWDSLKNYMEYFRHANVHSAVIALCSHWDWFIRKLSNFIFEYKDYLKIPTSVKNYKNIGMKPILEQIEIIEKSLDISLSIKEADKAILKVVSGIRNIGVHNRWEVDAKYLKSNADNWKIGEIRIIESGELKNWGEVFVRCIDAIAYNVAVTTKQFPKRNSNHIQ